MHRAADRGLEWLRAGDPAIRWRVLRQLGLPRDNRQALTGCRLLLERGVYSDGGISFGWGRSETCVNGMALSILAWFDPGDERIDRLADCLLGEQMEDGRWNLEHRYRGKDWFKMERIRAPSRWNTLRRLRVLGWWKE